MPKHTHPANPLALAVLALLFERPMHPYEMAATLKQRHKEDSIKLALRLALHGDRSARGRGFIAARDTSRAGKRPERTTYELTAARLRRAPRLDAGSAAHPSERVPQFTAGLSLLPVLPPEEAVALLRERAMQLVAGRGTIEAQLAELVQSGSAASAAMKYRRRWSAGNSRPCSWSRPNTRSR